MTTETQAERLLTIDDVAEICKVSTQTVARWVKQDAIVQPIRIGRRLIRWVPDDFNAWLESKTDKVQSDEA
jgi:predicted DNA-binding transcriptional regulator AlpA